MPPNWQQWLFWKKGLGLGSLIMGTFALFVSLGYLCEYNQVISIWETKKMIKYLEPYQKCSEYLVNASSYYYY